MDTAPASEPRHELDPFNIAEGRRLMEDAIRIPVTEVFDAEARKDIFREAEKLRYFSRMADPVYRLENSFFRRVLDRIKYL